MAASAEDSEVFDAPFDDIADAIDAALDDIGASSVQWSRSGRSVTASKGINFWSWGENLTVEVSRSGEVWVRSECAFPLQIVDWGKNGRNCRALLDAVARRLGLD
jgi:hypothetical protein